MSLPGSDLSGVVEERRAVVAAQQVLTGSTLDPVIATVAVGCVGALTGDDEVGAGTGEGLVVVGTAVDEVAAVAAHEDVVADATIESVVARTTLEHVGSALIGLDVVAVTTEDHVVAAVTLDHVVAGATQKVSLSLPPKIRSLPLCVVRRIGAVDRQRGRRCCPGQ